MQEIFDFIKLIWDAKTIIVVVVVSAIIFLGWGKIVSVLKDTKEFFKGGNKHD